MNYFFGVNNSEFLSEIQIPTFQNRNSNSVNISLFKVCAENNRWNIKELKKNKMALATDLKDYNFLKLKDFNNFTNTSPAYRANLRITLKNGGFSSYQSEYPYSMIIKRGGILSSVCSIANKDADKNYIFIKNICEFPIYENFEAYLVNIRTKTVEDKFEIKTNYTNSFELKNSLVKPEIFLITKNYLGIPMYVSVKNKHVSFEHTHPPHEYILSQNKFKKITELKKEINEIIN